MTSPGKFMACLSQIYGESTTRKCKLKGSKVVIGRSFNADIRLENPNVSRQHCILTNTDKGWEVMDNKSQNGTFVSGRKLKPGESILLQCGDIIFLGPPSEMPQAFCYDDAFITDDDDEQNNSDALLIPESLPVKHPAENVQKSCPTKRKNVLSANLVNELSTNVLPSASIGHKNRVSDASEVQHNSPMKENSHTIDLLSNKDVSLPISKNNMNKVSDTSGPHKSMNYPNDRFRYIDYEIVGDFSSKGHSDAIVNLLSPENFPLPPYNRHKKDSSDTPESPELLRSLSLNKRGTRVRAASLRNKKSTYQKMSPENSPFSKASKSDEVDSGYQIHEISSTGDEQVENSQSLLDLDNDEVADNAPKVTRKRPHQDPLTSTSSKEAEVLKSKVALLSEQIKKLKKSQLDLIKDYNDVCMKNQTLDEQLAEQNKLKEELELKAKNEVKNELLEKFEEDLVCNICTELLIKPTVLDCSHTFCQYCIKEWKKKKNECPMCRNRIQTMTQILTLEHFIDKALSSFTSEQRTRRNELIKERENASKKVATPKRSKRSSRRRRTPVRNIRTQHILPTAQHILPTVRNVDDDVEIVRERRNLFLPVPLTTMPYYFQHLRVPEPFMSDDGDSMSIYVS